MKLKKIIKKSGKIVLCSAIVAGSVGGEIVANSIIESSILAKAVTVEGNTYVLAADGYDGDEGYISTESVDGIFPTGRYTVVVTYANDVDLSTTGGLMLKINTPKTITVKKSNVSINGNTYTYTYIVENPGTRIWVSETGLKHISGNSYYDDYAFSSVKITIPLSDQTPPVIDGWEGVYYTNYESPESLNSIINKISAVDETDGPVEVKIKKDNYTGNEKVLGSHIVELYASDSVGNTSTITIDIVVVEATKPTISGKNVYISNMSSPVSEEEIRLGLTASDNYDSNVTIKLLEDNYTGHEQELGTYTIIYRAEDFSGNKSDEYVVEITTKDDIKPVISGTASYNVGLTSSLTLEYIKSQLMVTDNVDLSEDMAIDIRESEFDEKELVVGEYTIKFYTVDSSGNESDEFVVTVSVHDTIAPVFWTNQEFFSVDESLKLTHDQILEVLLTMNNIDLANVTTYEVEKDDYSSSVGVGVYEVSYVVWMEDGNVNVLSTNIEVLGEEVEEEVNNGGEKKDGFFKKISKWFKNIWKSISKIFSFGGCSRKKD